MNNYFNTKEKKDCNGCGVCALRCPQRAIDMTEDEEGFLYPTINKEKCIDCGLCKKICSNNVKENLFKAKTYIGINKNKKELKQSSSGGMFIILANYIIKKGGVVFGAEYDSNLNVKHNYYEDYEGVKRFQGSKYVRSDLNDSYIIAKKFLDAGKKVLFTGTPCQCQGLRSYLQKEYNNLITCDIICHANSSKKIFDMYKENISTKYKSKVKDIKFRDKETGWRCQTPTILLENGNKVQDTSYLYAFLNELINRPSCYDCHFCSKQRYSDFSIGDMWGIEFIDEKYKNNDEGISLLNINTKKGSLIFDEIKENITYQEIETDLAFSYNHNHNVKPHKKRKLFFDEVNKGKINSKNIIVNLKKYINKRFCVRVCRKIKDVINRFIVNKK